MTPQEKYLEAARRRLEEAALKYARMKTLGRYIGADGSDCQVGQPDQPDLVKMYGDNLLRAAVDLFAELANTPLPERA